LKYSFLATLTLITLLTVLPGCNNSDNGETSDVETSDVETIDGETSDGGTNDGGTSDSGTSDVGSEGISGPSTVIMNARSDFSCSSGWTIRDGALGLKAGAGSGTCHAAFPGESGTYRVVLTIQTEFDGQSEYSVALNGQMIHSSQYPLSSPLGCDCPKDDYQRVCPDKYVNVELGRHSLNKGAEVLFYGEEDWDCIDHGAYCKWHKITFEPVQ